MSFMSYYFFVTHHCRTALTRSEITDVRDLFSFHTSRCFARSPMAVADLSVNLINQGETVGNEMEIEIGFRNLKLSSSCHIHAFACNSLWTLRFSQFKLFPL